MTIKEEKSEPPRPTGKVVKGLEIEGLLMACYRGQIALLNVPGSEFDYLPLFPSEESLKNVLGVADAKWDVIKRVTNPQEFIDSIPEDIKIAVNPRIMPNGKVRWTEISR